MDRAGLAEFLKHRRAAITPGEVGLPETERRRTPGLRREEVAARAHMSVDFYERLEQARGSNPSEQTIAALARALVLSPTQRSHLHELAGFTAPPRAFRTDHPSPVLLRVLDELTSPAQIVTDLGVTLAQNEAARALIGDQTHYSGLSRSIIYRWFTDPDQRRIHPPADHDEHSRTRVSSLRIVHARDGEDPEVNELVTCLLAESAEFAQLWSEHEVVTQGGAIKRFVHPSIGEITLTCEILTAENRTEHLVVFSATPGSAAAEQLKLLAVVGRQDFSTT